MAVCHSLMVCSVTCSGGANRFWSAAIGVLLAVTGQPALSATLQGRVIHVVGGDTLVLRLEHAPGDGRCDRAFRID